MIMSSLLDAGRRRRGPARHGPVARLQQPTCLPRVPQRQTRSMGPSSGMDHGNAAADTTDSGEMDDVILEAAGTIYHQTSSVPTASAGDDTSSSNSSQNEDSDPSIPDNQDNPNNDPEDRPNSDDPSDDPNDDPNDPPPPSSPPLTDNTSKSLIPCRYHSLPEGYSPASSIPPLPPLPPFPPHHPPNVYKLCINLRCMRRNCRFLHASSEETGRCNICFDDNVKIFGLMSSCNHTFCMSCTRKWRKTKTGETAKTCPICRQTSKTVIPSSTFYPLNSPSRTQYIHHYKTRLLTKPCRYFEASKTSGTVKYHCPFWNDCQFVHIVHGERYVFSKSEIRKRKAERRLKLPNTIDVQRILSARHQRRRLPPPIETTPFPETTPLPETTPFQETTNAISLAVHDYLQFLQRMVRTNPVDPEFTTQLALRLEALPGLFTRLRETVSRESFDALRVLAQETISEGFTAWWGEDSDARRRELLIQMDELGEMEWGLEGETLEERVSGNIELESLFDEIVAQLPTQGTLLNRHHHFQVIDPPAMDIPMDGNPVPGNEDQVNEFITGINDQLHPLSMEQMAANDTPVSDINDPATSPSSLEAGAVMPDTSMADTLVADTPVADTSMADPPVAAISGIDDAMREARDRQWERLRRRLSRREMREEQGDMEE